MSFIGDFLVETTFDFHFTTRRFSTGAPFVLAGTPVVSCYEDNSTTQITAGITLTADFDTVAGLNHVRIVATAANGYEAGKSYSAVITTGTVDSVSVVGEVVGNFNLERAALVNAAITAAKIAADALTAAKIATDVSTELNAGVLAVLGALNDAAVDGDPTTTDTMVAYLKQIVNTLVGTAGIPTFPASAAPGNAVSLAEAIRQIYDDLVIVEGQTDDIGAAGAGLTAADDAILTILGTPAGASLAADIAAIEAQTDDIGVAGAGLTALASQASVDTIDNFLDTEIAAILAAVDTEVAAILALLDDPRTEPGQGALAVNPDMATKVDYLYKFLRNKKDNNGTETKLYADDAATVDHKQATSEAGGTVTKGEWATGP